MNDRREWLRNFEPIPLGKWLVNVANDHHSLWVAGVGDIDIEYLIEGRRIKGVIKQVLYIPELKKNVFSIGQVADKNIKTTYSKEECQTTNSVGKILMVGKKIRCISWLLKPSHQ